MEHKQGQHEHFSDYVSDTHNLQFKLKHKIAEDDFVDLLKDNMNSQMGGLLLTTPITSLAELKRERKTCAARQSFNNNTIILTPCSPLKFSLSHYKGYESNVQIEHF